MKKYSEIVYKGKTYIYDFNLNVMEQIQSEYGTVAKWGELTDGSSGEPDAKAIIFGFYCMLNEGIEISNEENVTKDPPLTLKQVGRMISDVGLAEATAKLNKTVVDSTASEEKNA